MSGPRRRTVRPGGRVGGHRSRRRCPRRSCAPAARGVAPTGVGAEGCLHHGQHPVGGDLAPGDPSPSRSSTTASTVATTPRRAAQAPQTPSSSGSERARLPSRRPRPGVDQGHVGRERSEQPTGPNGESTTWKASLSAIDEPASEPVTTAGRPRGGRLESLWKGEDRPVLDLDLTGLVGLPEDRVRRVGRERVPRVGGDDLPDQAAAEERARRAHPSWSSQA